MVLCPIIYANNILSGTEIKYGAPKAEMFAVVTYVENYCAYMGVLHLSCELTTEPYPG